MAQEQNKRGGCGGEDDDLTVSTAAGQERREKLAEDTEDLLVLLAGERVGREVPVKVVRGGEMQELQVTVGDRG